MYVYVYDAPYVYVHCCIMLTTLTYTTIVNTLTHNIGVFSTYLYYVLHIFNTLTHATWVQGGVESWDALSL